MSWREEVRQKTDELGLTITSGYRSAEHNRRIGGSPTSHHLEGSPGSPGAFDIGGAADKLREFFDWISERFRGRIRELYLNIPGGESKAIKGDKPLSTNPEAGKKRHVHIAIGGAGKLKEGEEPSSAGDLRGFRQACLPRIPRILDPPPCIFWSDVWFYSAGTLLAILGLLMLFGPGGSDASE
jgi:peptidase M15-like protein